MATQHRVVDHLVEHHIPTNLDRAISEAHLAAGDAVMVTALADAGDFVGAAAIRWGGGD